MPKALRAPFDSLVLAAIVAETRALVPGKLQRILQIDDLTVALGIYAGGREQWLLLSCDAVFARVHLLAERPKKTPPAGTFARLLRTHLDSAILSRIEQVGFDRILKLHFTGPTGNHTLIAELMGKHANLILVGPDGRVAACAKSVGISKSKRPVLVGRPYAEPPLEKRPSPFNARSWAEMMGAEGVSPFLRALAQAELGDQPNDEAVSAWIGGLGRRVKSGDFQPVAVEGVGAYPVSLAALGVAESTVPSLSLALEQGFGSAAHEQRLHQLKQSLAGQLERIVLAREAAIHDLEEAADTARQAATLQAKGDLILAYQYQWTPGSRTLEAFDFEGNTVTLAMNPELTALENAQRWFDRAKRAKSNAGLVHDQLQRLRSDLEELYAHLEKVEAADDAITIDQLREQAQAKRWLQVARIADSTGAKPKDPFDGHRIRSLIGPGGLTVLYGENATSNDFLTLRVAKPNDYWLHVRGHNSAHVVIQTGNHPEKVGQEALKFAAEVAVRNSPMKHSGYVPVDYTLKKYVRKPKGAPHGTALYTHEKTIHVDVKP